MDTSFGATYEYEMGPLTLGYERWANLSPDTHELQSFGHASISEEGTLEIKLMGIDGSVMFEMILFPEHEEEDPGTDLPTVKVTSPPTSKPSFSPTQKPSSSPTRNSFPPPTSKPVTLKPTNSPSKAGKKTKTS
jgi:hypothetical protein